MTAKILTYPNEILDAVADPVPHGERCRELIEEMFLALEYPHGIGLAAPQIGINKRVIVIKVPTIHNGVIVGGVTQKAFINPEIVDTRGELEMGYEGCLSFPGEQVAVPRRPRITVRAHDKRWNPIEFGAKHLVARVIQHEIDHLNGVTLETWEKRANEILGSDSPDNSVTPESE